MSSYGNQRKSLQKVPRVGFTKKSPAEAGPIAVKHDELLLVLLTAALLPTLAALTGLAALPALLTALTGLLRLLIRLLLTALLAAALLAALVRVALILLALAVLAVLILVRHLQLLDLGRDAEQTTMAWLTHWFPKVLFGVEN